MKNQLEKNTVLNVLNDLEKDYIRLSIQNNKTMSIHKSNLDTLYLNNFKMIVEDGELILEHLYEV